jgi:uncharacterized protein YkwD
MLKKTLLLVIVVALSSYFFSCETFSEALSSLSSSFSNLSSSGSNSDAGSATQIRTDPNRRANPDTENWDIGALDTAKDVDYLTGIEKDVILEMNMVRSNPKKYAELYIQPMLRYYNGREYSVPGQITILTQEGASAVQGCITALSRARNVGILMPEKGLSLATKDHVIDQGKTGQTGHNGSDRSTPVSRAARYGQGRYIGENISYGNNIGREIVCQLLIDDGVPSRGHRTNIMKNDYTQTGTSIGTHPQFRYMCCIAYAKDYVSK